MQQYQQPMQMILQNISLLLTHLSVHTLVKAFSFLNYFTKYLVFFFQFLLSIFGAFNIFHAFISIIIIIFFKIFFFKITIIIINFLSLSLFVLKNSFNNSVFIIALNLVSLLLQPLWEFPTKDFLACLTIIHSSYPWMFSA